MTLPCMDPHQSVGASGDRPSGEDATRHDAILVAAETSVGRSGAELLGLLYDELRSLARARLARIPVGQTLQPTALVHEAWMRISDRRPEGWAGRAQFFHAAARAMRDILVEDARRKGAVKRGGDRRRIGLTAAAGETPILDPVSDDVAELAEAIDRLSVDHPRASEVTMLRYFAGLTTEEAALVMDASPSTVERAWRFARAWLRRELGADPDGGDDDG